MFSENQKISRRQLQRLLVVDWLGKAGLLLPHVSERATGRDFMISLLLGMAITLCYAWLIGWISKYVQVGFYTYIRNRLGGGVAGIVSVIYICYIFVNTVYLVSVFAAIATTFMLPESSPYLLMGMVLLGGVYMAAGGLEAGARVGEILYGVVLYPLAFMLLFAAFAIQPDYLKAGQATFNYRTARHGLEIFTAFGGMGVILFLSPYMSKKEAIAAALKKSTVTIGIGIFLTFLVCIGLFGESGMWATSWPVITLMSSVDIPGGFLRRWDVIFTGLLLAGFFVAVAIGLFYMRFLLREVLGRDRSSYLPVVTVLVFGAAFWCGSYETAGQVMTVVNGCIMVPLAIFFTLLIAVVEFVKRRKGM